jgi:hypothetical protein
LETSNCPASTDSSLRKVNAIAGCQQSPIIQKIVWSSSLNKVIMAVNTPLMVRHDFVQFEMRSLETSHHFWSPMSRCGSSIVPYSRESYSAFGILRNILYYQAERALDILRNKGRCITPSDETDAGTEPDGEFTGFDASSLAEKRAHLAHLVEIRNNQERSMKMMGEVIQRSNENVRQITKEREQLKGDTEKLFADFKDVIGKNLPRVQNQFPPAIPLVDEVKAAEAQRLSFKPQADETIQSIETILDLYGFYGVRHLAVSLNVKKHRIKEVLRLMSMAKTPIEVESGLLAKPKPNYKLEVDDCIGGNAGSYFNDVSIDMIEKKVFVERIDMRFAVHLTRFETVYGFGADCSRKAIRHGTLWGQRDVRIHVGKPCGRGNFKIGTKPEKSHNTPNISSVELLNFKAGTDTCFVGWAGRAWELVSALQPVHVRFFPPTE